ncbi:GFA family protein [uncultured Microbulbifer sp.]|uniref:GFA family protein n=1 Tax=uncultured Microbulbifer sp. TaxID=348147 RepID=UPI00263317AB|nr:GFA family protein [uncultured Microbulbifer sp.]
MKLNGSCHCQAVRFSLECRQSYPFCRCYCSICCKTAGGGGYAVNLGGDYQSMTVRGEEYISVYQARLENASDGIHISPARRHFCSKCGSALWLWDPRWPELVHPLASAIDTALPVPPERTHLLLAFAKEWVEPDIRAGDKLFDGYPDESLEEWHCRHNL